MLTGSQGGVVIEIIGIRHREGVKVLVLGVLQWEIAKIPIAARTVGDPAHDTALQLIHHAILGNRVEGLPHVGSTDGAVVYTQGAKQSLIVLNRNPQRLAEAGVDAGVSLVADGDTVGLLKVEGADHPLTGGHGFGEFPYGHGDSPLLG